MKPKYLSLVLSGLISASAYADNTKIEEITIVGELNEERQIAGAAHYLGPDQLNTQAYSDIQRVLRQIPGVSLQIEDGYGLRPNISIRGVSTERSGRITLLEDGVLIAPAPYSAPSAYYFPTMGRMHAVEVLKGPSAITEGPYTIGGAMNMISTPVPTEATGTVRAEAGQDSTYRLHATYGATGDNGLGFLLEAHQWQSDGYQSIDRSASDTGLDVEDYTLKLSYVPEGSAHEVSLKLQYADQDSNQSYLGLTDADFSGNAFRRYGVSALDNIHTEHEQQILRYQFNISDSMNVSVTAYNNEHLRDWFKTEGLDTDGSTSADDLSRTSWFSVIQGINQGINVDGQTPAELQAILDGADTPAGSIQIRSNAREYYSRGVQLGFNWGLELGNTQHEIQAGIRYHKDEEDRLQRNASYHQQGGILVLDDAGQLGNAGNRIQQAEAVAYHVFDRITVGDWTFTPGLRYEDIDQSRTRYEIRPGRTADPASRAVANVRDTRANQTDVWLPGLGVLYSLNESTTLVGGVHKGFTAPTNAPNVDEEDAINYEFGVRYFGDQYSIDAMYFITDYDNILGVCTASSGSDCVVGDAFNGDAATVHGVELAIDGTLLQQSGFSVPVSLSYTYMDSQFDSDISGTDFFGNVTEGDPIPYIPEQQFVASVGYVNSAWNVNLAASYVDEVCVRASCNAVERTDDSFTIDLSVNYQIRDGFSVYGKVENLTGQEDIMGRHPYGARPNKDQTALLGVQFSF